MTSKHYANLTRGLLCPCLPSAYSIARIQSTHCEHKQWIDVLYDAGPQLLFDIAMHKVIVHDYSERPRETRAMWQGLTWIRYACERAWHLPTTPFSGRMQTAMPYFAYVYGNLPRKSLSYIGYYKQFVKGRAIDVRSCYVRHTEG